MYWEILVVESTSRNMIENTTSIAEKYWFLAAFLVEETLECEVLENKFNKY